MGLGTRWLVAPQKVLAAASVGASYTAVGTVLAFSPLQVIFSNLTDQDVQISFDGTSDAFPLMSRTQFVADISSNQVLDKGLYLAKGTQIYVKQIGVPSTGSFYVSYFYNNE